MNQTPVGTRLKMAPIIASILFTSLFIASCAPRESPLQRTSLVFDTSSTIGNAALGSNPNVPLGLPLVEDEGSQILISRPQYVLSWNKNTRLLNFAIWLLTATNLGYAQRPSHFSPDADLVRLAEETDPSIRAILPEEYEGSCFDRGHIVPAGDRTSNEVDDLATFVMSNVIPQSAYSNRVIWKHLESLDRHYVKGAARQLLIIAGPVIPRRPKTIGPYQDIPLPTASFKIVIALDNTLRKINPGREVMAVSIPNITSSNTDAIFDRETACADQHNLGELADRLFDANDWMSYRRSVRDIEWLTGISFKPLGID